MSQTDVRTIDRSTEKPLSPIRHIYPGYVYGDTVRPVGAVAYCGHVARDPSLFKRKLYAPKPDSCIVCWELCP